MPNQAQPAATNVAANAVANAAATAPTAASSAAKAATVIDHADEQSRYEAVFAKLVANPANFDHRNVKLRSASVNTDGETADAWFISISFAGELACGNQIASSAVLSMYSALGVLREEFEEIAAMGSWLLEKPRYVAAILVGATADVVVEPAAAQSVYINPFASSPRPYTVAQDRLFCHPRHIKLSKVGQLALNKAFDAFFES